MKSRNLSTISQFHLSLEKPFFAFLFAFITYFVLSSLDGNPFRVSDAPYFNYLADAFLHGQLYLRLQPPNVHDLSFFNGQYYLYWPPIPAIVLMPFVAVFGVNFSDVFFTILIAAANVATVAVLLRAVDRARIIEIDIEYRGMLVLFFALGTVHVVMALFGKLWFTSQLFGFLLVSLAYLSAIELEGKFSFFVTGLLMACAMLTRNNLLFAGIWPAYYLLQKNWSNRSRLYLHVVYGLLPVLTLGLLFLAYNFARFGNPFEFGYSYHHMNEIFIADYQKYGAFNLHYLPTNFYYQYIHYPLPFNRETLMGGSLFLLSPLFFNAFKGIGGDYRSLNVWMLILSVLMTSIPIFLLMGTGWIQYGPRYTLDFTIPLLLLTAKGCQLTSKRLLTWLIAVSIIQYIPGILLFAHFQF